MSMKPSLIVRPSPVISKVAKRTNMGRSGIVRGGFCISKGEYVRKIVGAVLIYGSLILEVWLLCRM